MFYFETINNKKILKSSALAEFKGKLAHLFTTKESFIKTKDENLKNLVKANRELVLDYLKIEEKNLIEVKQTHGTNIISKIPSKAGIIDDTDGVILYKPGTATILNFADCTPVILYDPENTVAAVLHAGWRGTAGQIARLGVKLMKENFASKPEKLTAAIGPCIAQEDFETGYEVYEALKGTIEKADGFFIFRKDKVYPDLAKINAIQLIEEGIKNIDISQFKTTSNNEYFFSYRKENGTTSRISAVLKII